MSHHPLYSADVSPVLLVPVEAGHSPSVNHVSFWVTFLPLLWFLLQAQTPFPAFYFMGKQTPRGFLLWRGQCVPCPQPYRGQTGKRGGLPYILQVPWAVTLPTGQWASPRTVSTTVSFTFFDHSYPFLSSSWSPFRPCTF